MKSKERIKKAIDIALECGGIDGGHHKAWIIDQMLRYLLDDKYEDKIAEWKEWNEEEEDYNYEWDEGIAP